MAAIKMNESSKVSNSHIYLYQDKIVNTLIQLEESFDVIERYLNNISLDFTIY